MKITFVHIGRENLGIEYLSSALKEAGHTTSLAYDPGLFGPEDNVFYVPRLEKAFSQKEKILTQIEKTNPDLVAFSVYTSTYRWACDIARVIKKKLKVKTVWGGIHPTLVPEIVIKNDFVDFVIEGEGEYPLRDLVQALTLKKPIETIENLWYKQNGQIIKKGPRPPVPNLDCLPPPDKELFSRHINYRDDYMIMTGRGCVFNCSYCCESFMNKLYANKFYRRRSVASVMQELLTMKQKYNFREVMFFDALLFTDKHWLEQLLARYKREIAVPFRCLGKVTGFDENVGRQLKEAGCYCVNFGMQTLNEQLKRDVLGRGETNRQAQETFNLCDKLKLRYDIDHKFGLPRETEKDYIAGAQFYGRLKYLNRIKCFELTYFPKTLILNKAKEAGILNDKSIAGIEIGETGNFFHSSPPTGTMTKNTNKDFKVFYKFLPLLPNFLVRYIIKRKVYRAFRFIPFFIIVFLQILVALRGRDYRYLFYFKYYLWRIKRAGKIKNDS
jgi:radical SAM superfamily enzyme YgiQ (UPF0313 family)